MAEVFVLRKPLLIVATVLAFVVVMLEIGSGWMLSLFGEDAPPGMGICAMVFVDGAVFVTLAFLAASVFVSARVMGMIFGISNFLIFLFMLLGSIAVIFIAIGLLILMVSLVMAIPFGTLIYIAKYGSFETGAARAILALIMTLKFGVAGCLAFAHPSYLTIKSLILLLLTSILASFIVMFLLGFPPGILVSITDAIAAIIVGILGAIWCLYKTIMAIPAAIKGLRVDRHVLGG